MSPNSFLRTCCLAIGLISVVAPARAQGFKVATSNAFPTLVFSNPVCMTTPPGETNRLFVVEKHGRVIVITNLAAPTRTIFLDIVNRVRVGNYNEASDVFGEEGLLGIAFHPDYANNGYFYVTYTATNGTARDDILSRFQVSAGNSNAADANSEVRYLKQFDEASNHNAGDMHFGPDGYLYVALGDEGGSFGQFGNSQRIDRDYFSAIMRIDVDNLPGNLAPNPHAAVLSLTNYSIPADNPWVGATSFNGVTVNSNQVRTEFYCIGMRNPWRMSFDKATGLLYVGHVGQGLLEWVNLISKGDNAGWNYFEGTFQWTNTLPPGFTHIPPLIQYGHTNSRSAIIGGVVYHSSRVPQLKDAYIYGDEGSSEIFMLRNTGMTVTQNAVLFLDTGSRPSCFGFDPSNGDVLYAALRSGNNSIMKRIVSTVPSINTVELSDTNLIASGAGGNFGGTYTLLSSFDLTLPSSSWTPLATNSFDGLGNFSFTIPISLDDTQTFFKVRMP